MSAKSPLYDSDFYAWSREQAELLRAGKLAEADIEHIAEEIDSMGRTEKRELDQPSHRPPAAPPQVALSTGQARPELGSERLEPARRHRGSSRRQPEPEAPSAAGVGFRVSKSLPRGGRGDGTGGGDVSRRVPMDGRAGLGRRVLAGIRREALGRGRGLLMCPGIHGLRSAARVHRRQPGGIGAQGA